MKKVLFLITLCLFLYALQAYSFENEPDGFRGIVWGTDISQLKDMEFVKVDPKTGIKLYKKKKDNMTIGNANLDALYYGFFENKFYAVIAQTMFFTDFEELKRACFENFGRGEKPRLYYDEYFWDGEKVKISLIYDRSAIIGTLMIVNKELDKMVKDNRPKEQDIKTKNKPQGF
ncbi:MAG: hypothetical protein N2202_01930 [Proteobacteria bacterium]|nr:hypothetical protein [Pseudomonadota bacterium]